ncbi:hypothetical protein BVRB_1g003200 [Beta vulgaris subsp. vulgaris]|nr:hypothetical protein BVRB_1g003200 [Beta vulgaris subsp. vulgaris]
MPKIRSCCLGVIITILSLQLVPQYCSSSALFQRLSTKCRTVITELSPCADFIRDQAALPEEACCSGVRRVAGLGKSPTAVTAICECLKQGLDETTYDPIKVQQLPKECKAQIDFPPVNSNIDCTSTTTH